MQKNGRLPDESFKLKFAQARSIGLYLLLSVRGRRHKAAFSGTDKTRKEKRKSWKEKKKASVCIMDFIQV